MSIRKEQCNKVCRILDDVLANRPTERDSLIIAVRKAFESLEQLGNSEQLPSAQPEHDAEFWRKRAEEYSNICLAMTAEMTKGIKFNSIRIDENGICFGKEQPEQKWIPCSERLPEEEIEVLVTRKFLGCKDSSHGWNNHIPPSTYVEVAQYSCGEWEALSDEYKIARNRHTNPIAWMPLPEAYREEGT